MMPAGTAPALPSPEGWDPRFVFPIGLLLAVAASLAILVFGVSHVRPSCDEALAPVRIPPGWQKWRDVTRTSSFRPALGMRGDPPLHEAFFYVEDGVCPGEEAVVDGEDLRDEPFDDPERPPVIRIRESPSHDVFVVTLESARMCRIAGPGCEAALSAFRPELAPELRGLRSLVVSPRDTRVLVALHAVAAAAIAWGIARARRNRRLARELLDPARFVEATCREDGTLVLEANAVVVREGARRSIRPGPVLIRVRRTSGGEYRTPPSVRVDEMARGGRAQASQRAARRASRILNSMVAVAVTAGILGGSCALTAWVQTGHVDSMVRHRHGW
jgi:hypothetical protein